MPTLETILGEVDQFVESDKTYNEAPHIIDVVLPLLCSYLPFWWAQGPDNVTPTGGLVLKGHGIEKRGTQVVLHFFF